MKTFIEKLRSMPMDKLLLMIARQEREIRIVNRDLLTMQQILSVRKKPRR